MTKNELKKWSLERGAALFGVADITSIDGELSLSAEIRETVTRAVCVGVGLSDLVLSEIDRQPTKLYFHHYRMANMFLDQLAFVLANAIANAGYRSVAIPASQIIDWDLQKAHVSHKKIGILAGLGWIGRNNLLVNPEVGARFRLATVLTDLPLEPDQPLNRDCGDCQACVDVCPAGAIAHNPADFNHMACYEQLKGFQRQNIVGQYICGVCVKACAARGANRLKTERHFTAQETIRSIV